MAFVRVVGREQAGMGSDMTVVGVIGLSWRACKWQEWVQMSRDVCE